MQLVAMMSLDADRGARHRLYRTHAIEVFSEIDIKGYHHEQTPSAADVGWFGHATHPAYSTLTWAFLPDPQATQLLNAIEEMNTRGNPEHPVRAFEMPVNCTV